jgi:hypothetical protein
MAMIVGASDCSTGMAKAIYDSLLAADSALAAFIAAETTPFPLRTKMRAMCFGIAGGIVTYIQANAVADIVFEATGPNAWSGIQTYDTSSPAGTTPTGPAAAHHSIAGAIL